MCDSGLRHYSIAPEIFMIRLDLENENPVGQWDTSGTVCEKGPTDWVGSEDMDIVALCMMHEGLEQRSRVELWRCHLLFFGASVL